MEVVYDAAIFETNEKAMKKIGNEYRGHMLGLQPEGLMTFSNSSRTTCNDPQRLILQRQALLSRVNPEFRQSEKEFAAILHAPNPCGSTQ